MTNPETSVVWTKAISNELGRLAQSYKYDMKHTDTIESIPKSDEPEGRVLAYANIVLDYRLSKSEPNRIYLPLAGDILSVSQQLPSLKPKL